VGWKDSESDLKSQFVFMPHENKFYIHILVLALFLVAVLVPIFILLQKREDLDTREVLEFIEEEIVRDESVYELFNGTSSIDDENIGQYFIDDPFREACSNAEGAVTFGTVCVK
jgi:hypothetical protein